MHLYLQIFGAVFLVSALSLVGLFFLSFSPKTLEKLTLLLVSLSAGTLLGDAFLHLLPEAVESSESSSVLWYWVLVGLFSFFILEKVIHWRHCHIRTCDEHPHHLGVMNLVGDTLHNFFDGAVIAASFLFSPELGVATLIAVLAHELPQEIADFGVLIYAGYSRGKALLWNFLTALSAFAGAIVVVVIGGNTDNIESWVIPFTAGGFIYIATGDLIPELKKETGLGKSLWQLASIIFGVLLMFLLRILFE